MIDAETRAAIQALVTEFSFRVDHGEATGIPELFTEDGRFESPMAKLNGKDAITAAMAQRAHANYKTRHVVNNLRLKLDTAAQIRGTVLLTLYRWKPDDDPQAQASAILEYEDVYVRGGDGQWLFASRKAIPVLPPNIQ